jgi:hypothetical protein
MRGMNLSNPDNKIGDIYRITNLKDNTNATESTIWFRYHTPTPAYNLTVSNLLYNVSIGGGQARYYTPKNIFNEVNDFKVQPLSVILVPFTLSNSQNMFCYGNGAIFTEIQKSENNLISKNTLKSHQIFIGNEMSVKKSTYMDADYKTYYHSVNNVIPTSDLNNIGQFDGKTFNVESLRFTSNASSKWSERNFIKTYDKSNTQYTCIVPTMMCDWHNIQNDNGNYSSLRPVVGLYTAMNINYSYVLGSAFGDEFITFRKTQPSNTSPGIATHQSEIGTITNEATEYASAI